MKIEEALTMFRKVAFCMTGLAAFALLTAALPGCGSKPPIENRNPDLMNVERLVGQLDEESKTKRIVAINHIASLGSRKAEPAMQKLQDVAENDPDEAVRNAARDAINRLQN